MRIRLDREDQVLLREATAYMARRMRDPSDVHELGEIEDRLDALLLGGGTAGTVAGELILEGRRGEVLCAALESYATELARPGSDFTNRPRVARLRRVIRTIRARSRWFGRLFAWLRK
jgi:hypothetical protein